uniref:serine--tRNA ligase n=1 Tax=Timema cristinae TaxID=61476 RepID=A0A7R9GWF5_TIMCR|nr:unnamed protein product [Timema cristinae]
MQLPRAKVSLFSICKRLFKHRTFSNHTINTINIPTPELDVEYLCDSNNICEIEANIINRKGVGDIHLVHNLSGQLQNDNKNEHEKHNLRVQFENEAKKIPNRSHPTLRDYGETPKIVCTKGSKKAFPFSPREFEDIAKNLNLLRTDNLGNLTGHRSYYFLGELSQMERALVNFSIQTLLQRNFHLVSVPDILPGKVVESCGMSTDGDRTQVYKLDPELHGPDLCLSGTSEMALAACMINKKFLASQLPLKLAAVSRCFRAETSSIAEQRGIFRVHQFTKVEMFGVTNRESSEELLEEFRQIQEHNFSSLGLHFQTLDMPLYELGAPAYRKYDVEAWMPGRALFGEISSCSNCTDYQSRRLNIKYSPSSSTDLVHAHTVNGTACAVPRMLIALFETYQESDGTVTIPQILQPYMKGKTKIVKQDKIPKMKLLKSKHLKNKS